MIREIIYFGDPMCSWCWGFSPVIREIREEYAGVAPVRFVVGGLHAYETEEMSDATKAEIKDHWKQVEARTGAHFDYAFFEREEFVLDTEPACRAAVTARTMNEPGALDFYEAISRSFYIENQDTTSVETFCGLAAEAGLDADTFAELFESDEMKQETRAEIEFTKKLGITGFPTVVVREDDRLAVLTIGWQPFEALKPAIDEWLAEGLDPISDDEGADDENEYGGDEYDEDDGDDDAETIQ